MNENKIPESDPVIETRIGDTRIILLGTAHVSRKSAEAVERMIDSGDYDAVAVELCASRHHALSEPEALARMDLLQVMRQGKAAMVTANLAMGAYQQRLAEQYGIKPGAEMRAAMHGASTHELPLLLIDREIGTTLKRTAANLSWWKRWSLFSGLLVSLVSHEDVEEDEIEKLKEGDMLETTFAEFAHDRQDLYQPLIAERDRYMAAKLLLAAQQHTGKHILAVVGAGHLKGIGEQLQHIDDPQMVLAELDRQPPQIALAETDPLGHRGAGPVRFLARLQSQQRSRLATAVGLGADQRRSVRAWAPDRGGPPAHGNHRLRGGADHLTQPDHRRRDGHRRGRADAAQAPSERFQRAAPRHHQPARLVAQPGLTHPAGVPVQHAGFRGRHLPSGLPYLRPVDRLSEADAFGQVSETRRLQIREEPETITGLGLGRVHGVVGMPDQRLQPVGVLRIECDTDTGADPCR